jgi:NADPH-dependent 2,4-dienoyl-CoA reductase/sulfur reductase-like enzyme
MPTIGTARRAVVVGGDAAGMGAALQIRRHNPGLEVVVFERGPHIAYGACGIPHYVAGEIAEPESLLAMTAAQARERGLEVRLGTEVTELRVASRSVAWARPDGQTAVERFDYLVLATGGTAVVPAWDGVGLSQVFTLRSLADGVALRRYLDEGRPTRAVVVGAGFLGLEMAEALLRRGLQVAVVARSGRRCSRRCAAGEPGWRSGSRCGGWPVGPDGSRRSRPIRAASRPIWCSWPRG